MVREIQVSKDLQVSKELSVKASGILVGQGYPTLSPPGGAASTGRYKLPPCYLCLTKQPYSYTANCKVGKRYVWFSLDKAGQFPENVTFHLCL